MVKGSSRLDPAFNVQQHARDQAEEEARRIPWRLLQEARSQYVHWYEFYFLGSIDNGERGFGDALVGAEIEGRCPGFLEDDSRYPADHPNKAFFTPVRLGFCIDDHVFAFAKKGGWFNAIAYYALREPRYQRVSVCWSQSVERWRRASG